MLCLYGADDDQVDPDNDGWSKLTTGPYRRESLSGGHFYTPSLWRELPRHLGF
jgi:surfactin synthase thioesterase subunit